MATKIEKLGIKREKGWLYYMDKNGNVARAKMSRGGKSKSKVKPEVIAKLGIKRQSGYLYFVDKQGDLAMAKMARRGKKK